MSLANRRSTVILYSDPEGFYSHSIRIVLFEKDVQADIIEVDPEHKPEVLSSINPHNSLPTLVDKELVLHEPKIMLEYLDERFPHPPLLPVYPVQRALSRLWITRVEKEWSTKLDIVLAGKGRETVITKARKELRESIIAIAPIFGEKPFFMNEEFSLVDCCVAPILWRLKEAGITLPEKSTRPLLKYMHAMFERDAFRESLTEAEMEMQE